MLVEVYFVPMIRLGQRDFARLIGALLFVGLGAAVALVLACLLFPPPDVGFGAAIGGTLDSIKAWSRHEAREKAFYFFSLVSGGILSCVGAARWSSGRRVTPLAVVVLVALVPAAALLIGAAMPASRFFAGLYVVPAIVALLVAIWLIERVSKDKSRASADAAPPADSAMPPDKAVLSPLLAGALAVVVLAIATVPLRAGGIAALIGFDMHMASFMVGPATYSFGANLLPGIDYFTQYSVGTPWLFSFFLAPTATQTMVNAVWFIIAEILVFQITLFFFLWWFLRSWWWALIVALACLLLQFTTPSPLYAPSSTSARFPLLIVSIVAFVHWIRRDHHWIEGLLVAAALSLSLFLNTETGIYSCAAAAITVFIMSPGLAIATVRTFLLGVATFAFFMVLNLIAFGPGVMQIQYVWLLLEPLTLYSEGLGAWPIEWIGGYYWIYNVVSPGIALASIGWVAVSVRRGTPPLQRAHLAALAMLSLIGLFLTAKYINMSIVGLWQVNSLGLVIVAVWWARALIDRLPARRGQVRPLPLAVGPRKLIAQSISMRTLATLTLAFLLFVFLGTIEDLRNPSLYGIPSYRTHPTLVNALLGGKDPHPCPQEPKGCASVSVSLQDVALIDDLTKPKDRVALLMLHDWTTLIEAKRSSKFHFLPSVVLFTDRQMEESLRNMDLLFLPREPAAKLGIGHPDMEAILLPMLRRDFKVVAETPTLLAWRRVRQ